MGLPLSATITESRSMNSSRPATMPPSPSAAGRAPAPAFAADSSIGWYARERASWAATPLHGGVRRRDPLVEAGSRQRYGRHVVGRGLEEADTMGDGVEEAGGGHPARLPGVLRDDAGERLALLGGRLRQRAVEHACVGARQILRRQQAVDIRERPAVDRSAGDVVGGEAAGDTADCRLERGERPAVPFGRHAGSAIGVEAGEADAAAHAVRHSAALAVVAEEQRAVVLVVVDLDVSVVARLGRALVGRAHAGLGDQRPRNRGAPERLAGTRHDGPALGQRLFGERPPDGVGEVAAEMREPDHGVLSAVHAARQRRHEGDGNNDAHDRPCAEAEAPLPRRVHDAGGGVPDQHEARQHDHARVEGEQHVAHCRGPVPAEAAQEGQHVARGAVGVGEEAAVDRLRGRRVRRRNRRDYCTRQRNDQNQPREAGTGQGSPLVRRGHSCRRHACLRRSRGSGHPAAASDLAALFRVPGPGCRCPAARRFRQYAQHRSRAHRLGHGAAEFGGEQEAERAHGAQFAPAAGLARPGRRRISSVASASDAASMAPLRSSVR